MAVRIQVMVFWVMTPCNNVDGYKCFRGLCCFHHQGEVNDTRRGGIDIGREYKRRQKDSDTGSKVVYKTGLLLPSVV
jgi:hypothetical protein